MLGKLLKYDFKAIWRDISLMALIALCASAILGILIGSLSKNPNIEDTFGGIITLPIIPIGLFLIVSYFIIQFKLYARYYTNLMTDEGYLSFTLPVTVDQQIISKIITVIVWQIIVAVIYILAILLCVLMAMIAGGSFTWSVFSEFFKGIGNIILSIIRVFSDFELAKEGIVSILLLISGTLLTTMEIFFAMTIAGLVQKAKFLAGIGAYIGVNSAISVLSTFFVGIIAVLFSSASELLALLIPMTMFCLAMAIVLYFVIRTIFVKGLNLN